MVDLQGQYHRLKEEIDAAMQTVIESSAFINGPQVKAFGDHLADYLDIPYGCSSDRFDGVAVAAGG